MKQGKHEMEAQDIKRQHLILDIRMAIALGKLEEVVRLSKELGVA